MKTKKGLLEKRSALKGKLDAIKPAIEGGTITDEQLEEMRSIKSDIVSVNEEIANLDEQRHNAVPTKDETRGAEKMDKDLKKLEKRAAADLFRNKLRDSKAVRDYLEVAKEHDKDVDVEDRALQDNGLSWGNAVNGTASDGGVVVPTTVADTIIEKLQETSPVFALANKIGSITGNLRVARETDNSDDGFVGELEEVKAQTPTLKYVELTQKRVGASMQLSNMMINDGAPDIVSYAVGRLGRSLAKAIERAVLIGAKTGEDATKTFKPVVGGDGVQTITLAGATPTLDELIGLTTALNPAYLGQAVFVMSREAFNAVSKLKDDDNEHLIFKPQMQTAIAGAVGVRPGYSFQGIPVFVSDQLNGNANGQIVLGNFNAGYTIMTKQGLRLTHVTADTQQALAGGHLIVLDGYMDGGVTNPDAFVVAKPASK
ncbi:hypothetical protein DEDGFLLK_00116 [Lactiplantibacillus phage Gut-P1]|nr:hypothetical protein DEDGFLLK_00116 [Lactiplantibacillus phage Gut-P1]